MPGPVLVSGAAGFAGSHLVDLLVRDGVEVVGWHRPAGRPGREARVEWHAVDVLDRAAVRDALVRARPAAVYHCAGAADVGRSWATTETTFAINVRGTHHIIEGLRRAGIDSRVLIVSSATVYAASTDPIGEDHPVRPTNPYGLSKLAQELVGGGNLDAPAVLIARAFNHFGPRQDARFVASAFAQRIAHIEKGRAPAELPVGNLEPRRDLTDVRDTVRAYRAIVERGVPGRVYNVCSGRAILIRDLLDKLLSRARVPIRVAIDPERYRPTDAPLIIGSPQRIQEELSWRAEIPLERTLDDLLEYWRARS
jgi:GDP-4-dehydro-6-deoxy-D-mannose reductase